MLDDETSQATRTELLRLAPSGDLFDLAREMREMGVESLLFCSPAGRIRQVVTDRQIAHLAASDPVPMAASGSTGLDPSLPDPAPDGTGPAVPPQGVPAGADTSAPAYRR